MENETRGKRIEKLEKKVEKLEQNQREIVSLLNKLERGRSYYVDENGDIKSFCDD
jgi:ribosomal 50S subunit-associated protein YjgA (DUF615 family)